MPHSSTLIYPIRCWNKLRSSPFTERNRKERSLIYINLYMCITINLGSGASSNSIYPNNASGTTYKAPQRDFALVVLHETRLLLLLYLLIHLLLNRPPHNQTDTHQARISIGPYITRPLIKSFRGDRSHPWTRTTRSAGPKGSVV